MKQSTGPRAVFGVAKKDIAGVLMRALAMYNAMLANTAVFASPTVALTAFISLINALSSAQQTAVETRTRGTAKARDSKRNALWTAMISLQAYVQSLANALTAADAAALIELSGMVVAKTGTHTKAALAAALTSVPGNVSLEANRGLLVGPEDAAKTVVFNWQMSMDGGKTWTSLPSTGYASTEVTGLTLMTTYTFHVSVTVAKVPGAWSQPVSIVVH